MQKIDWFGAASILCFVLFSGIVSAATERERYPDARYFYVLTCDARLDRIDTWRRRKLSSTELPTTFRARTVSDAVGFEGCLANNAAYDPSAHIFYTATPDIASVGVEGYRDYRGLGFSVPDARLTRIVDAGRHLAEPPDGSIAVTGEPVFEAAGTKQSAFGDLGAYGPVSSALSGEVLEASGPRALVEINRGGSTTPMLAVADRSGRALAPLADAPAHAGPRAHLTPGGRRVLIVDSKDLDAPATGRLLVYDGASGRLIRRLTSTAARGLYFLAIAPNGVVIFHRGDLYRFVELGVPGSADTVERRLDPAGPAYFFADR